LDDFGNRPATTQTSSGNVTDEVWKKYIEEQKPENPDDNFLWCKSAEG